MFAKGAAWNKGPRRAPNPYHMKFRDLQVEVLSENRKTMKMSDLISKSTPQPAPTAFSAVEQLCEASLPPQSVAYICSYECTFCPECGEKRSHV